MAQRPASAPDSPCSQRRSAGRPPRKSPPGSTTRAKSRRPMTPRRSASRSPNLKFCSSTATRSCPNRSLGCGPIGCNAAPSTSSLANPLQGNRPSRCRSARRSQAVANGRMAKELNPFAPSTGRARTASATRYCPVFWRLAATPEDAVYRRRPRSRGKRPFDPAGDMPALAAAIEKVGDVALIVLDPIALTVKGDCHKNVETESGCSPSPILRTNRRLRPRRASSDKIHRRRRPA